MKTIVREQPATPRKITRRHVLSGLSAAAACGLQLPGRPAQAADRSTLRIAVSTFPYPLDPLVVTDVVGTQVLRAMYEGLTTVDTEGGVKPALAESWQAEDGATRWRIQLRKGVRFHSGRPVTAEAVKRSFEAEVMRARRGGFALSALTKIVGFDELSEGRTNRLAGVRTTGEHDLEIACAAPNAILPLMNFFVVDMDHVEAAGPDWHRRGSAGTGPYRMEGSSDGRRIDLVGNRDWWGGQSLFERVAFLSAGGEQQAVALFMSGDIDFYLLDTSTVSEILDNPGHRRNTVSCPRIQTRAIALNQDLYAPFRDIRVRRALSMIIDHEAVAERFFRGYARVHHGVVPPDMLRNEHLAPIAYDPAGAVDLLAQAGHPRGKGMGEVVVWTFPEFEREFAYYVSQWRSIGVPARLEIAPRNVYLERSRKGEYQAYSVGWTATYPDAAKFLQEKFDSRSRFNQIRWKDERFDSLIDEAMAEPDPVRRAAIYKRAERIVMDDLPQIPLAVPDYAALRAIPEADAFMTPLGGILPR